jgi:hypothetical protein
MLRSVVLSVVIVAVLSLSGTAGAKIWHVHPDSAISSIQAGIDSSSHGDTVLVYPETYYENTNFNGKNIVLGSLFLMTGGTSYISSTIIDADSSGTVVTFENGEDSTAVLTGFTIQYGNAQVGGGIYCLLSSPSLTNVTISGNTAHELWGGYGGGIYCGGSSPSLENVTIEGNTAGYGSGIFCSANSNPSLSNVIISGNSASYYAGGWGGGICCGMSSPSLTNVIISGNDADDFGGGIYCYGNSSPCLTNVIISGNTAGRGDGGGIYCSGSSPSLTNVTISGNTANWGNGGGLCCNRNSSPNLVNCILFNDAPQEICFSEWDSANTITISYSDIQGDSAGIVTNDNGTVYWLEGNIDADPLFADTANADFSLTQGSPCIDAGTVDTIGLGLPPWDILRNQRIWDGDGDEIAVIDMGAYEYGAPPYTGIDEKDVVEPRTRIFLHNYPNPFSPQTTIRYGLAKESRVSLKVYNALGQEVSVLVDKLQQAGTYRVVWDTRDNTGRKVSSSTYFLRLEARQHTATRKLCVVR